MKLISKNIVLSFLATRYFRYIHGLEKNRISNHSIGIQYLLQNRMFST